jgi:hypothetical protein
MTERERSPIHIVQTAIDGFNRGDTEALIPGPQPGRRRRSCPDAAAAAIGERPLSIRHISCLEPGRVFCSLTTVHGSELVGLYSIARGRISQARHYFSDLELLASVGILGPAEVERVTGARSG